MCLRICAGAEPADKYSTLSFLPRGMSVRKSRRVSVILIDHRTKEKRRARGMQKGSRRRRKRRRSSSTATSTTMEEFCNFAYRADWQNWNRFSSEIFWSSIDNSLFNNANEVFGVIIPRFNVARSSQGNTVGSRLLELMADDGECPGNRYFG